MLPLNQLVLQLSFNLLFKAGYSSPDRAATRPDFDRERRITNTRTTSFCPKIAHSMLFDPFNFMHTHHVDLYSMTLTPCPKPLVSPSSTKLENKGTKKKNENLKRII